MLVSLGLFDGFFLFIDTKCNRTNLWTPMTPVRPHPSTSSAFFHVLPLFPLHQIVPCALPGLFFYGREDKSVWVHVHVCVYFKYYYYYQHAIHLKAPSKLEPSRGAVGNDLPTKLWLVWRLIQKAASFGGLFTCLVAFLIFGADIFSHVVRNAVNCSF